MEQDTPTIITLGKYLLKGFTSIPQIIKDFIKENHYKHTLVTIGATFLMLLFMNNNMHLKDVPQPVQLLGAFCFGWAINFLHEVYYLRKNKTPISYNDVITGAWFALLTTLIYNLYV